MQCPNCQRKNQPDTRFCVYCGTILPIPESEPPPEPGPEAANLDENVPSRQVQALEEEVRRQAGLLALMNDRLAALELGKAPSAAAPSAAAPVPAVPPPPMVDLPVDEAVPEKGPVPALSGPESVPSRVRPKVTVWRNQVAEAPPRQPKPPPRPRSPEWEWILGGNWLARIGVLALIIGMGFFLKFAFDNEWINETARIVLGIVAGLGMLGLGHFWHRKYPTLGQAISGGGVAVLYLSVFAAFAFYGLINFYLALGILALVSAGSAALALRYDSMALAILGIAGAFSAPFVLAGLARSGVEAPLFSGANEAAQAGRTVWLIAYVMVIDVGVLWLSSFRTWRWFTLLGLVGSLAVYGVWYGQFGQDVSLATAQLSLTGIFLIFVGASSLYHIVWRRVSDEGDYALIVINAAAYAGITYGLLQHELRSWLGGISLSLAVFYGGLSYLTFRRSMENSRLGHFLIAVSLLFLTVAIPLQLGDRAWTTITWAAEGAILMWLSFTLRMSLFRVASYVVLAVMGLRLLFFDSWIRSGDYQPVLNERFLAFIVSIVVLYLVAYLVRRYEESDPELAESAQMRQSVFLVSAGLATMWIVGVEVVQYFTSRVSPEDSWALALLLPLVATTLLHRLAWRRPSQALDVVLAVGAVFYLSISLFLWDDLRAWMGGLYFTLALLYGGLAVAFLRRGKAEERLGNILLAAALVLFTLAAYAQLENTIWTTIVWAVEGAALVWLSFRTRLVILRFSGYVVFALMAIRLLFFDTSLATDGYRVVLNERFLVFLVGIAATYFVAAVIRRHRDSLGEVEEVAWSVYPVFITVANFLTVWLLSAEVISYFSHRAALDGGATAETLQGLKSARNLSLTVIWTLYAVVLLAVGIARRSRLVRLTGLAFVVVPIVKLFVYDVFALEQVYRIAAFISLGVLLVVSGYLYQRYSGKIKEFLVSR